MTLPYRIAVLCYIFDADDHVLLLHRRKPPNRELYSPVGGKLEQDVGESPSGCAVREIREETGLEVGLQDLHLTGIVSECAFNGEQHWLMFLYEVLGPRSVAATSFDEGQLEWWAPERIGSLPIPETDRQVIWPLFWKYRGSFFMAHIDCSGPAMRWELQQPPENVAIT